MVIQILKNKIFITPNVIIAGGVGSFEPRKFSIEGIEKFENKNVFYSIREKNFFKNKKVLIAGGGDSALDWTNELAKIADVVAKQVRAGVKTSSSSSIPHHSSSLFFNNLKARVKPAVAEFRVRIFSLPINSDNFCSNSSTLGP